MYSIFILVISVFWLVGSRIRIKNPWFFMDPENLKNPCAYLWLYFAYLLFWCFESICILYSYLYFACVSAVHIIYLYPLLLAVFRLCIRSLYHHSVSLLYCLCVSILYPLSISSPLYSTASACIPTLTLHLNVKSFITAHIIYSVLQCGSAAPQTGTVVRPRVEIRTRPGPSSGRDTNH